jgi:hypothetical protein
LALFPGESNVKDGIQLGGPRTLCYKCEAERRAADKDSDIPYGDLEYKEVFKVVQNGLETCLCMRHFMQMCTSSHYMLIDTNEAMAVPLSAMEEPVEEAVVVEEEPKEEEKPK